MSHGLWDWQKINANNSLRWTITFVTQFGEMYMELPLYDLDMCEVKNTHVHTSYTLNFGQNFHSLCSSMSGFLITDQF